MKQTILKTALTGFLLCGAVYAKDVNVTKNDNALTPQIDAFISMQKGQYSKVENICKKVIKDKKEKDKSICYIYLATIYHDSLQAAFKEEMAKAGDNNIKLILLKDKIKKNIKNRKKGNPYYHIGKGLSPENLYKKSIEYSKKFLQNSKKDSLYCDTANYILAEDYFVGIGNSTGNFILNQIQPPKYQEAFKYAQNIKDSKNNYIKSYANYILGLMYKDGTGTLQDLDEAKKHLKIAISLNEKRAKCPLGEVYAIKGEKEKAKKILKEGYQEGLSDCQNIWNKYKIGQ